MEIIKDVLGGIAMLIIGIVQVFVMIALVIVVIALFFGALSWLF